MIKRLAGKKAFCLASLRATNNYGNFCHPSRLAAFGEEKSPGGCPRKRRCETEYNCYDVGGCLRRKFFPAPMEPKHESQAQLKLGE
jgi:hypothetical protein